MDLYIIGIDQRFDNNMVMGFIDEFNTHYPTASGLDGGGVRVFTDFEIPYTPSLILIAPDHSIVEQAIPRPTIAQDLIDFLESYHFSVSGVADDINGKNADFIFFPNPVENQLNIKTATNEKIKQIKIYQLTGQEIFSKSNRLSSIGNTIDVSFLNKGIYLLSVEFHNGQRMTKTFIKK